MGIDHSTLTLPPISFKAINRQNNAHYFKGKVGWDGVFAHWINDLKFLHVVPIFTELGQDLTHLAHTENTQSDIFLWDRGKILIAFCSLGALYNILSPMVEILTLWSPHMLLKNLGALSEYAKCSWSSTKIKKKLKSLLSVLDTMEW
jgi:hypothetical protein